MHSFQHVFVSIPLLLSYYIPKAEIRHNLIELDTIPQYYLLKAKLLEYEKSATFDSSSIINFQSKDSSKIINAIAKKLCLLGYITDTLQLLFSISNIKESIKEFQFDNGLPVDGVVGKKFKMAINIPISERIKKIKKNLQRAALLPNLQSKHVIVNIPDYELKVYDHDSLVLQSKIIIGKKNTKTLGIYSSIEYVVFNPYWNIPRSIMAKEILPAMKKDSQYLTKNDMEWAGDHLRQKPGEKNALGRIKFIFPNPYNIYLHDTPNKNLFTRETRMFSHGCIRIAKPMDLADYLLKSQPNSWSREDILKTLEKKKEVYVKLNEKVIILVCYMTAFVAENGRVNFRNDVYRLD